MPLTNEMKARVLDALYGGAALDVPSTLYVGLSTTSPNPDGSGFTEPSGNGYARAAMPNDMDQWYEATEANPSVKSNAVPVLFPEASGDWGEVTHWGIFDAETGGKLLDWAALDQSFAVGAGQQPQFREGDLQTRLQNG